MMGIAKTVSISEIESLYFAKGLSANKASAVIGVSATTFTRAMRRFGLKQRERHNCGKANARFKDGSCSRMYRNVVKKEQCNRCESRRALCIHHINNDHYDNRPENMEVLCASCHASHTKKMWWDAKRAGLPLPKSNYPSRWPKLRKRSSAINRRSHVLAADDVRRIRELHASREANQVEIARMFNISQSMVSLIVHRKQWGHVQ